MIIHKDLEQGSDEWFNIRKFKMTASNADTIAVNGKGLDTYIKTLVSEGFSKGEKENYTNGHMARGNELEPFAREMYELETGNSVEQVGFIEYNEFIGCSPDGLIGNDGGIEIKCLMDSKHFGHICGYEKMDTSHYAQIQMCLFITGRQWWDYILYNPNYEQSLIIKRILPDAIFFKKLKEGLENGERQIKELIELYKIKKT